MLISLGAADADALREQHRETPTRHHADARVRVGEAGAVGRDQEVAVERDLEAAGDRDAVDRADERLRVRRQRAAERRAAVVARSPTSAKPSPCCTSPEPNSFRSTPARERGIGAGEDHHVDVVVGVAARDRGRQRLAHRRGSARCAASGRFSVMTATRSAMSTRTTSSVTHASLRKSNATLIAPVSSWVASVVNASRQSSSGKVCVSMPVRSTRPLADEVEVVLDAVLAHAVDLLEPERVRADHRDLLEVQRRVLPPRRPVHAGLHERAARLQHARRRPRTSPACRPCRTRRR